MFLTFFPCSSIASSSTSISLSSITILKALSVKLFRFSILPVFSLGRDSKFYHISEDVQWLLEAQEISMVSKYWNI